MIKYLVFLTSMFLTTSCFLNDRGFPQVYDEEEYNFDYKVYTENGLWMHDTIELQMGELVPWYGSFPVYVNDTTSYFVPIIVDYMSQPLLFEDVDHLIGFMHDRDYDFDEVRMVIVNEETYYTLIFIKENERKRN